MKKINKNITSYTPKEYRESIYFLLPIFVILSLFVLLPVIGTIWNSFFQDVTFLDIKWIGLENYKNLLKDGSFWQSVRFTLMFTLVSVPLELVIGLICALVMNESIPGRNYIRAIVLIPWAIPTSISARTWELIYNYHYGLANYVCGKLGISESINWLGTTGGAFFSLVLADAWKTAPFVAVILLAGLSAIPDNIYRQAKIDGTNFAQRFVKITLPILKPIFIVALLFRTIDALRVFDLIFVLTHGGPAGSTASLSMYGYKFFVAGDFGYGSAVSVMLFIVAFSIAMIYIKKGKFTVE